MDGFEHLVEVVRTELRAVGSRIDITNEKLDQGLSRVESKFDQGIATVESKFDQRLARIESKFDQGLARIESKLDETNSRIAGIDQRLSNFQGEVLTKFNGVGDYLDSIDNSLKKHDSRVSGLEVRVEKLEREQKKPGHKSI